MGEMKGVGRIDCPEKSKFGHFYLRIIQTVEMPMKYIDWIHLKEFKVWKGINYFLLCMNQKSWQLIFQ